MYERLNYYLDKSEIDKLEDEMNKPLKYKGLLINPKRINPAVLFEEFSSVQKDLTNPNFYTYSIDEDSPGKHILHSAGAYYMLDRSSMIVSKYLDPKKRELVLDMCAAPGGKTISYALKNPHALIIANDFSAKRAIELSGNVERMGIANVIVTNFQPSYFLENFSSYFDKIILDAPCSGTGMFRKESKMKEDWSYQKTLKLLPLQDQLLETGYKLLARGGSLSYSTCSFLKEEDEDRVEALLRKHSDLKVEPIPMEEGYFGGTIDGTIHLFPHIYKGEGHFLAKIKKDGKTPNLNTVERERDFKPELGLYSFKYNSEKHALPYYLNSLIQIKALRMGLKLTNNSKYSKCPHDHALSRYLSSAGSISLTETEAEKYLKGQELFHPCDKADGYYPVSYLNVNIGYVNKKGSKLKNCYPKGLRKK